jgi:3-oxoacyl-[acyl-carrier protein] reductase
VPIPAMFDLSNRVALVAGGSKGIGEAFARQYVEHGGRVIVASRDLQACENYATRLNTEFGKDVAWGHDFDLAETPSIDVLIDDAVGRWGSLDTLFCSSYFAVSGTAAEMSDDDFAKMLRVNIVNYSHMAHRALPALGRSDLASVIFVSSASGVRPSPHNPAYGIAKMGLTRLGQTLAIDWGRIGVRVNVLTPGMTRTPLVMNWTREDQIPQRVAEFPLARIGLPEEIAAAGIFLAAPAAGYITGAEIIVDGGRTLLSGNTGRAFQDIAS